MNVKFPDAKIKSPILPSEPKTVFVVAAWNHHGKWWKLWPGLYFTKEAAQKHADDLGGFWMCRQIFQLTLGDNNLDEDGGGE